MTVDIASKYHTNILIKIGVALNVGNFSPDQDYFPTSGQLPNTSLIAEKLNILQTIGSPGTKATKSQTNKVSKQQTFEVHAQRHSCAVRGRDGKVDARHMRGTCSCRIYRERDQTSVGSLPSVTAVAAS